jgi:hypothetical protein
MLFSKRAGIALAFVTCCGLSSCMKSAPPRILPELPDSSAASKAMELYDSNHDGVLDAKELEKVPGLKAAIKLVDTDHDGKISKQEIADHIKSWADSLAGRVPVRVRVTRNGQPLVGALVTFVPEKFLGANLKSGTGTTSSLGTAMINAPNTANPKAQGLAPGFYRVEITKDGERISAKYNTETTLGAEACREDQQSALNFDVR